MHQIRQNMQTFVRFCWSLYAIAKLDEWELFMRESRNRPYWILGVSEYSATTGDKAVKERTTQLKGALTLLENIPTSHEHNTMYYIGEALFRRLDKADFTIAEHPEARTKFSGSARDRIALREHLLEQEYTDEESLAIIEWTDGYVSNYVLKRDYQFVWDPTDSDPTWGRDDWSMDEDPSCM